MFSKQKQLERIPFEPLSEILKESICEHSQAGNSKDYRTGRHSGVIACLTVGQSHKEDAKQLVLAFLHRTKYSTHNLKSCSWWVT